MRSCAHRPCSACGVARIAASSKFFARISSSWDLAHPRLGARAQDLERPEATYRALGAKLIVGMPFKDQATSDSLLLPRVPPAADRNARRALARLQARHTARVRRPLGRMPSAMDMAVTGAE